MATASTSQRNYDSDDDVDMAIGTHAQFKSTGIINAKIKGAAGHQRSISSAPLLSTPAEDEWDQLRRRQKHDDDYNDDGSWKYWLRRRMNAPRELFKRNEGFLYIALAQAFFASIGTCVKLLQDQIEMPVWEIIFIRMIVTWLGCYMYMRWTKVEHPLLGPPGVRLLLAARGFVGFFGLAPGYFALKYLSLSDATVLSFISPVLVGLLASVFLKEPYSKLEATAGLVSLVGVVLIAKPTMIFGAAEQETTGGILVTPEQRMLAIGVALLGTFGAAGAYLIIRAIGKRAHALHSISFFAIYSCIVSCMFPILFNAPPVLHLNVGFFLLITPIGIFGFIAQALLTLGLQLEKAGRGTLAVYSNLLFAILLERVVFNHFPDGWSLIGASIIVGCAVRVALDKTKKQTSDIGRNKTSVDDSVDDLEAAGVPDQAVESRALQDLTSTHVAR
ncbi:hypothetical protein OIO90_001396 [Microbotryomycetes sp. JL221]|nr:hypothetical protein OIO90_001396 [Microbotryomycetes sp. JL221]